MDPKVTEYIANAQIWQNEMMELRTILLDLGMVEEIKWNKPSYLSDGKIIVVIQAFKSYFALLFYKGYLLKDENGVLVKTGENTNVGRQLRFSGVEEILNNESIIRKYIGEAIEIEKSGINLKVEKSQAEIPLELLQIFVEKPLLKKSFEALSPGKQRGYLIHFTSAKNAATRISRILKNEEKILSGKGFNNYQEK